jgi:probable rRNA maturation factor
MSLVYENEVDASFDFDCEEVIRSVTEGCLEYVGCPFEVMVEVTLVDNEEIRRLNKEYRQIDRPTDVLSFPMVDYETPGDFSFLENDDDEITAQYFDCETGELLLGDIVLSVDKVRAQAEEYGHSQKRELAFLTAHSMFHLFGYDHMEEDERMEMERMQKEVLEKLGIYR